MKHYLEKQIINICNSWKDHLNLEDESLAIKYEVSKHRLRNLYLQKTGQFLKLPQNVEGQIFAKIVNNLSKRFDINENLIDTYLNWCFANMDFFIEKYSDFSLNNISRFANEWEKDLFNFDIEDKITLKNLESIQVSSNIFLYCERFGIPLVASKLKKETKMPIDKIKSAFMKKLITLTENTNDLGRLRKMLMRTVENAPYGSEIIFWDYQQSLNHFFTYFSNESWNQF